jgi:hypothetical protein
MSKPVSKVSDVRVPGPLAPFAAGFRSALLGAGYTPLSAVNQMRLMVHLSRWLEARRLSAAELTEERVEEYLGARRAAGYVGLYTRRGLAPLLDFLADDFVVMVHGDEGDVETLREEIIQVLAPLGLRLSQAKTRVVHL